MPALVYLNSEQKKQIANWIRRTNEYDTAISEKYTYSDKEIEYMNVSLKNSGVMGIPYQFNSYADTPRYNINKNVAANKYFGRIYEDKIIANAPILHFEVGRPVFMDKFDKDQGIVSWVLENIGNSLEDVVKDAAGDAVATLSKGKANKMRYYGFKSDYVNYAYYVNAMAKFTAIKMGIGNKKDAGGKLYKSFNILTKQNKLLGAGGDVEEYRYHLPIYCNAEATNVSENISNTVGESQLAGTLKDGSSLARELSFLLNTSMNSTMISNNTAELVKAVDSITGGIGDGGAITGLVKNIATAGATIVSGANMMMPLIWQDSAFTKTYNLNIKLSTPYGDPEAVFNDIYVPIFCILAMSMPRQTSNYGYSSPFIVRASCKGYFNCDMGMIESVEIKRAGQTTQDWTVEQLPTEVEVNIVLKDLYPTLVATQTSSASFAFATNTGLIDYLNMMAGLNLTAVGSFGNLVAAFHMFAGTLLDIPTRIQHTVSHAVYANLKQAVRRFFK